MDMNLCRPTRLSERDSRRDARTIFPARLSKVNLTKNRIKVMQEGLITATPSPPAYEPLLNGGGVPDHLQLVLLHLQMVAVRLQPVMYGNTTGINQLSISVQYQINPSTFCTSWCIDWFCSDLPRTLICMTLNSTSSSIKGKTFAYKIQQCHLTVHIQSNTQGDPEESQSCQNVLDTFYGFHFCSSVKCNVCKIQFLYSFDYYKTGCRNKNFTGKQVLMVLVVVFRTRNDSGPILCSAPAKDSKPCLTQPRHSSVKSAPSFFSWNRTTINRQIILQRNRRLSFQVSTFLLPS